MSHHLPPDDASGPDTGRAEFGDPEFGNADVGNADFDAADLVGDPSDVRDWPEGVPGCAANAVLRAGEAPAGPVAPEAGASSFLIGADAVRAFVAREWTRKLDYRLKKEVWSYSGKRISILFEYEWHDAETDRWMLTHGEEAWEIAADGLLSRVKASGQDIAIAEIDRWVLPRPLVGPTPVD